MRARLDVQTWNESAPLENVNDPDRRRLFGRAQASGTMLRERTLAHVERERVGEFLCSCSAPNVADAVYGFITGSRLQLRLDGAEKSGSAVGGYGELGIPSPSSSTGA